jgi:uncharacterized phage protein (TIGR02218 family)
MKSISSNFNTHLDEEVTTLTMMAHITRTDGQEFFLTAHDTDLVYDGDTYRADIAFKRTAIQQDEGLAVDNLNIEGVFDDTNIKLDEMRAGKFDNAEFRLFIVNWNDLAQGDLKVRRGNLGNISDTQQGRYVAELRGMMQKLAQNLNGIYKPECGTDVGNPADCKFPIDPPVIARDTNYSVGDFVKVVTDGGATGQAQYENRIYECTRAGLTGPSQPTFSETVNTTTDDTSIAATGTLTLTGNATNGQTVTIDTKVYTFQTSLTDVDGNVLIGATASDSLDNLIAAINLDAGAGSLYATSMTIHPTVSAAAGAGDTMDVTAKTAGADGNDIETTETLSNGSWGDSELSGGVDGAIFTARSAFMRHGVIDTVTSGSVFTLTSDITAQE